MRVVLASTGTTGDVLPIVWLGKELKRRGHAVTLALPPNYAEFSAAAGLLAAPLGHAIDACAIRQVVTRLRRKSLRSQLADVFAGLLPNVLHDCEELKQLCSSADVLVASAYHPAGRMVHDATKIPFATVHLGPTVGPQPEAIRSVLAPLINAKRRQWGLQPLHDPGGIDSASPLLALHAVSRLACKDAQPPDPYHVTGFFFGALRHQSSLTLRSFLESGDSPIVCTFGSMVQENAPDITKILAAAAGELRRRIVIQWPWEADQVASMQTTLGCHALVLGHVPHDVLFSKSRLVIHHGGAGTSAATLRAGVPSIVVPHILDQPEWANILRNLGCAPGALCRSDLTLSALTVLLAHTLDAPSYQRAARRCAEIVSAEPGIQRASDLIETLVSNRAMLA